jgi:hypothetical protein
MFSRASASPPVIVGGFPRIRRHKSGRPKPLPIPKMLKAANKGGSAVRIQAFRATGGGRSGGGGGGRSGGRR